MRSTTRIQGQRNNIGNVAYILQGLDGNDGQELSDNVELERHDAIDTDRAEPKEADEWMAPTSKS
jgi:hypothetical protein